MAQWIAFVLGLGALEINVVYPALALLYALLFARHVVRQVLPILRGTRGEPIMAAEFRRGIRVPKGECYARLENPRGELGYYVVSNGDNRPWRVRTRPPSMYNLQVLKKIAPGELIADMVVMIGSLDPVFGEVDR